MAADEEENEEGKEAAPKAKGNKGKLILVGLVIIVGGTAGAGGVYYFSLKKPMSQGAEHQVEAEHGKEGEATPTGAAAAAAAGAQIAKAGPIVPMTPFTVNLADAEDIHYLKCTIAVELASEEWKAVFERVSVPARDAILVYLSSLTVRGTQGIENKKEIRRVLTEILTKIMGEGSVRGIYVTEFVIQ